eukprot:TRINITY_DN2961_c0_g1_i3.p1 TRINITY_DN2961_c0_g1~~TRINITY_DN2961_c0_g1_i3.p1  ORF type:complete len:341 (-),score=49.97 TRINITY_DN2961_c0_g1_i3:950-1972(-)
MSRRVLLVLFVFGVSTVLCSYNFLVFGDWGGQNNPYGGTSQSREQLAVAKQMGISGGEHDIQFVLNVGDNFYPQGVKSVSDPLWDLDFKNVYTASSLNVPWISALGNHDYGGNIEAELEYKGDARWILPARNYTREIKITKDHNATLVMIDSSPGSYTCKTAPKDCKHGDPQTEEFWTNVLDGQKNWKSQMEWLEEVLSHQKNKWIIAMGHHPVYDILKNSGTDIAKIFSKYDVAAYYCGHVHDMAHFEVKDVTTQFYISGAGSLASGFPSKPEERAVRPPEDIAFETAKKIKAGVDVEDAWSSQKAGFAIATFNDDASELKTTFIDWEGAVVKDFVIKK